MKTVIPILAAVALFSGCAAQQWEKHELTIQLAVRAATARLLHEKPTWVKPCYRITSEAIKLVDAQTIINVDQLVVYVMREIPWDDLLPEERTLLELTIEIVAQEIRNYLAEQNLEDPGAVALQVQLILTWINQTAEYRL